MLISDAKIQVKVSCSSNTCIQEQKLKNTVHKYSSIKISQMTPRLRPLPRQKYKNKASGRSWRWKTIYYLVIIGTVRLHMVTIIRSEAAKIARVTLLILVLCIDVIFQALSNLGSKFIMWAKQNRRVFSSMH